MSSSSSFYILYSTEPVIWKLQVAYLNEPQFSVQTCLIFITITSLSHLCFRSHHPFCCGLVGQYAVFVVCWIHWKAFSWLIQNVPNIALQSPILKNHTQFAVTQYEVRGTSTHSARNELNRYTVMAGGTNRQIVFEFRTSTNPRTSEEKTFQGHSTRQHELIRK